METINIYVGTDPYGADAESLAVLDYTIHKHTTGPFKVHFMRMTDNKNSPWYVGKDGWDTSQWPTPFSGYRWGIPYAAGYMGRAVY